MKPHAEPTTRFEGRCAFAVRLGKLDVDGSRRWSLTRDGKTYLFSNPVAKLLWRLLPGSRKKAEARWSNRPDRTRAGSDPEPTEPS